MSEIRVNTIANADGTAAPTMTYGFQVPTGMGITGAGGINISGVCTAGIVTATNLYGTLNGNSTGLSGTPNISCGTIAGSTGTFSGAVNVDATTDSTSATTGALIVDGGLGVAKNVYIGAGLSVAGTLTYQDVTEVDSVGLITAKSGVNITGGDYTQTGGGEFKVGTAVTISATAGVTTFSGDVIFDGATEGRTITFDKSDNALKVADNTNINIGTGNDLKLYHDASDSYIQNNTGILYVQAKSGEHCLAAVPDSSTYLYFNGSTRIETTKEGAKITGFTSTTAGLGVTGGMFEGAFIKAGKLSDNQTIGISTSNIFVFTTTESTTATPNIIWDDDYALSSKMNVGDAVTVTIVTTAAAAGYAANITVDGNAVTEEWLGGSAPSEGGSGGYDVYSYTLIRKAAGTGDTGWITLANKQNYA